jgi:hypothetical protein
MVDRTPQDFGAIPDGMTDATAAIQAAIDTSVPGDRLIISGGTFALASQLLIPVSGLSIVGDGRLQALAGFGGGTLIEVQGQQVIFDTDGLELDQAGLVTGGVSVLATGAAGLELRGLVSRGTGEAFVRLGNGTTDALIVACDHEGEGSGVQALDPAGLARLTVRGCRFAHPGTGAPGDGISLACPTHGADEVSIVDCQAEGYIGAAGDQGRGFAFARNRDGKFIGCRAEAVAADGVQFTQECANWLAADLRIANVGESGLVAYDCDDLTVVLAIVQHCAGHGIALSGEGRFGIASQQRVNGWIERCTVDTTGRDGIHFTAQRDFQVDRNAVRDPSLGNPGVFAGIHVGQQGGTSLENANGLGEGNLITLSGATTPLGEIVVRPTSQNTSIDGVVGQEPFADGTFWTDGTGWVESLPS